MSDSKPKSKPEEGKVTVFQDEVETLNSADPRTRVIGNPSDSNFDFWSSIEFLAQDILEKAKESDSMVDSIKAMNALLGAKKSLEKDPAYLMKCLSKMTPSQQNVFASYLQKHNLMRGFRTGKIDKEKLQKLL